MSSDLTELIHGAEEEDRYTFREMTQSVEFVLAKDLKMNRGLMIQLLQDSEAFAPHFPHIIKVESSKERTGDGATREVWTFTFTDR